MLMNHLYVNDFFLRADRVLFQYVKHDNQMVLYNLTDNTYSVCNIEVLRYYISGKYLSLISDEDHIKLLLSYEKT